MAVVASGEMLVTPNLSGFESKLSSAMGRVASSAGRALTAGITAAAAAGAATVTGALVSGFGRLTTIEDSTRSLTLTLGDATKAGKLLGEVLTVVKGTPFALDQFAAGAQQLVGFGVQAEKVPGILTAIGDAASTQGKRAGEFAERLILVFGQIAAKGRIQLEDVWRISETGVNALQILGNHFNLTSKDMQDMISDGAVPAGEAMDALVKGITKGSKGINGATKALGGLAQTLGTTLSGSLANFRIAFTRAGASTLAPFSQLLTTLLQKGTAIIDKVGAALSERAARFVKDFDAGPFLKFIDTLPTKLKPVLDGLKNLGPALAPIAGLLAGIASTGLAGALGPLGALVPAISPLVGLFIGLVAASPALRDALAQLGPVAQRVLDAFGPALKEAIDKLAPVLPELADAFVSIAESIATIMIALTPLIPALATVLVKALELTAAFITWADQTNILTPLIAALTVAFTAMWLSALGPIGLLLVGLALVTTAVVGLYQENETFRNIAGPAVRYVVSQFESLKQNIENVIGAIRKAIDLIKSLAKAAANLPGPVKGLIRGAVPFGLGNLIPGFAEGGVVPGPLGRPRLAVVHGGEEVLTPDQRRGGVVFGPGAVVVNLNGNVTPGEAYAAGQAAGRGIADEMARTEARRTARTA